MNYISRYMGAQINKGHKIIRITCIAPSQRQFCDLHVIMLLLRSAPPPRGDFPRTSPWRLSPDAPWRFSPDTPVAIFRGHPRGDSLRQMKFKTLVKTIFWWRCSVDTPVAILRGPPRGALHGEHHRPANDLRDKPRQRTSRQTPPNN